MVKYLNFIEKTTKQRSYLNSRIDKKELFFAKIKINPVCPNTTVSKSGLSFVVSDDRLINIYSICLGQGRQAENCTPLYSLPHGKGNIQPDKNLTGRDENKIVCSLNWINTRNKFSLYILESLLDYQSKYWFSGKEADIKPLTFEKFLSLYPFRYLDKSRLSRLIANLSVINPQNRLINLKSLFRSKKKYHAYIIKEIVPINQDENILKDKDIQYLLSQRGISLSVRTICNCRKLLHIPSYKEKFACYYGKEIIFSDYIFITSRLKKNSIGFQMKREFMN